MKLRVIVDGEESLLEFQRNAAGTTYRLDGSINRSGNVSTAEIAPGVFSILFGQRSYTVHVLPSGEEFEVWTDGQRHLITAADVRDSSAKLKKQAVTGPMELLAQMPGKIVKLLVEPGAQVQIGQSLIVVEAMKMQNEMKSPKDGVVKKIHTVEGATVAAGERLMVVE